MRVRPVRIGTIFCASVLCGLAGMAKGANFTPPQSLPVVGFNIDIVTADVDSDGDYDIVSLQDNIFDGDRSNLQVLINNGAGVFSVGQFLDLGLPDDFAFEAAVTDLTTGDFNADGRADFAVIGDSLQLSIVMNAGGVLQPRVRTGLTARSSAVAEAGDLDGDGDADIVFGHTPRVAINNGNLTFTVLPMADDTNTAVARIVRLNGDAIPDVAYAYGVYINNGAGVLTRVGQYPVAGGRACGFGDFDHDGDNDVASPQPFGPGGISRLMFGLNDGNGVFTQLPPLDMPSMARVETATLDDDDHLDLVVSQNTVCGGPNGCTPANFFSVLRGQGDGTFSAPQRIDTPALRNLAVRDLNGDGLDDIVLSAGNLTGTVSSVQVLLNGATPCAGDASCNDGLFCNGVELCEDGTCEAGANPCAAPLLCRESDDRCVSCLSNSNCDDGLFCNGAEICTAAGTCQAGSNPCAGQTCDETNDRCVSGPEVWMSFTDSATVPGVGTVQDEDIVSYNLATGTWSLVLDGSDIGLSGCAIDGMARMADGSILLSFADAESIAGLVGGPSGTSVDDSDIVRFIPTSLGANTAGSFVFYFDGSDVGLTANDEDIDGIALTATGDLVLSFVGSASANGASAADTDLLRFSAASLGANTAGTFSVYFDGSDVGLSDNGNEDVDAVAIRLSGALLFSTLGNFAVTGVSGADEDVLQFTPTALGANTAGGYALLLDLSALGIAGGENIGSLEIRE